MSLRQDHRSVAVTVNYVIVVAISAILVAGLLVTGGSFVEDQRDDTVETELTVIGNHIAGNIEQVDRYVAASEGTPEAAYVNQSLPQAATGSSYTVTLSENPDQVVLVSARPEEVVRINVSAATTLDETRSANGGAISVAYDPDAAGGSGGVVVTDA